MPEPLDQSVKQLLCLVCVLDAFYYATVFVVGPKWMLEFCVLAPLVMVRPPHIEDAETLTDVDARYEQFPFSAEKPVAVARVDVNLDKSPIVGFADAVVGPACFTVSNS